MEELLGPLLLVVFIAFIGVWLYNRYQRVSKYIQRRQTVRGAPAPGEQSSAKHQRRAEMYAERLTPQAEEAASRLLGPEENQDGWKADGIHIYKRVAYRIPADNNWRASVTTLGSEIRQLVDRHHPEDDERAGEFAAYLATVAAEALVFMLPSSGGVAATQLLREVGDS